jgi:hypothetical protein
MNDEEMKRDAARWRWLREQSKQVAPVAAVVWQVPLLGTTADLDTAVDRYVEHDE